jgi:hypothetical protein
MTGERREVLARISTARARAGTISRPPALHIQRDHAMIGSRADTPKSRGYQEARRRRVLGIGAGREGLEWLVTRVLAVLLPVSLLVGSLAGLETLRSFNDARENRNAGKVINGHVVSVGVAAMIDQRLDKNEPYVVILGNSLSNTDLAPNLLAARLGIPTNKVQKFSIPNSMGAHWYAIVKNRIYANGHQPAIVLILSDLQSLLALAPRSEASYLNLAIQLGADEPVIDAKLGHRFYYLERVRENRGRVRDLALLGVRNRMVDLLVHHTLVPTDPKKIERTLADVFDASRVDMRLHSNALPIFNTQNAKDLLPFDPSELPTPEDSFLADMSELVQQNGGHLVVLRPPMSPIMPDDVGDVVFPEHVQGVYDLLDRTDGTFLDLRDVDMDVTHFQNPDHMNAEGARRFTEIVAELLVDVGGGGPPSAELLKTVGLVDGRYASLPLDVAFRGPPPPLIRADRSFGKGRGRTLVFQTDAYGFLNDAATGLVSPHATRCSPLRVLEDGVLLPHPNESCDDVQKQGRGRMCHTPDKVFFTASDGSNPFETGRDYRLALDPMRTCDGGLWAYPGDTARVTARAYDRKGPGVPNVVIEVENRSDRFLLLTSMLLGNGGWGG